MTPERLAFIKQRIVKNLSSPDMPELALELCAELEKHIAPPVAAVPPPPPVFVTDGFKVADEPEEKRSHHAKNEKKAGHK